eukprot:s1662_g15.t1
MYMASAREANFAVAPPLLQPELHECFWSELSYICAVGHNARTVLREAGSIVLRRTGGVHRENGLIGLCQAPSMAIALPWRRLRSPRRSLLLLLRLQTPVQQLLLPQDPGPPRRSPATPGSGGAFGGRAFAFVPRPEKDYSSELWSCGRCDNEVFKAEGELSVTEVATLL